MIWLRIKHWREYFFIQSVIEEFVSKDQRLLELSVFHVSIIKLDSRLFLIFLSCFQRFHRTGYKNQVEKQWSHLSIDVFVYVGLWAVTVIWAHGCEKLFTCQYRLEIKPVCVSAASAFCTAQLLRSSQTWVRCVATRLSHDWQGEVKTFSQLCRLFSLDVIILRRKTVLTALVTNRMLIVKDRMQWFPSIFHLVRKHVP